MTTVLDVVVPVHDEEAVLAASVHRLHDHLVHTFPYPFRITVADNASTDGTWRVAERLTAELPAVVAVRLAEKGRGRALHHVWSRSDAVVLAYMDVDLSTDLDALWPLVAPLMSGHSDIAIGTRLHRSARVVRGPRREVISRCYNLLLRATLGTHVTDAQCGFKAIRADVAAELLPLVEDTSWFFDTELLVLAQPVDEVAARIGRGSPRPARSVRRELAVFAVIGVLSTVLHLGGFVVLRQVVESAAPANAVALLVAAVVNTWANRRWTFGVRGRAGAARHQVQGLLVFALTLGMTTAGLDLLHATAPEAPTAVQTLVVAVTTALATAVKFLSMKLWVFAPSSLRPAAPRRPAQGSRTAKDPLESSKATTPVQS